MEKFRKSIEQNALLYEQMGLSPVGARVFVYLLYAPYYSTTFEDLTGYFKVSKSAISNAIKYLILMQMIGSKTKNGQRKRYFGVELEHFFENDNAVKRYELINNSMQTILRERKFKDKTHEELKMYINFLEMMMQEMPLLIEKFKKNM